MTFLLELKILQAETPILMMHFIKFGGHSKVIDLFLLVLCNLSFCPSKLHLFFCTPETSPYSDGCSLSNSFYSCIAFIVATHPPHLLTAYTLADPYPPLNVLKFIVDFKKSRFAFEEFGSLCFAHS